MFMKKLIVAAALTLCAAGAYASNFRAADQVYIPAAGKFVGGSGTFVSDVYLANLSTDAIVISVIYQPVNTATNPAVASTIGTEFKDVITLQPLERKEFKDFFPTVLGLQSGFGQLILNGCKQGADCGPSQQGDEANSQNYRPLSAESRIYSFPAAGPTVAGTTGQLFSGIPWYNFVSMLQAGVGLDRVFLTGVTHTATSGPGTFRTNFGLVNASQYSTTNLQLTLYKGRVRTEDKVAEKVVTLTPLENISTNFPALFPSAPLGSDYFVVVQQISSTPNPTGVPSTCDNGCPAFLAYGSVLDNITGDATTLESQYLKELDSEALLVIYAPGIGKGPIKRSVRH
jgi:hypothetical protein